jgi:hypothetical protein
MEAEANDVTVARKRLAKTAKKSGGDESVRPACPVCGGHLLEIHSKLYCSDCHAMIEMCCD